jgi:hypothetical protein
MCDECHQSPCATMCPNNTALADDDPIMKTCPICEECYYSDDSMDYPVCFGCLCKNMTFDTAEKYGDERKINVEINAFWAKLFPAAMINEILREKAVEYKSIFPFMAREDTDNFFKDDLSDFADWLKERNTPKKIQRW